MSKKQPGLKEKNLRKKPDIPLQEAAQIGCDYLEINRCREEVLGLLREEGKKTFMIASPRDDTGNTLFVSMLGINCVKFTSMQVAIIDLNMRSPQVHKAFNLSPGPGFRDIISNKSKDLNEALQKTQYPSLSCITAGISVSDIVTFLSRSKLEDFVKHVAKRFDLVLFDTSPVLVQNKNNVDPSLLSLVSDASLLLVRDRNTTRNELQRAVESIPENSSKLKGIIYNLQF